MCGAGMADLTIKIECFYPDCRACYPKSTQIKHSTHGAGMADLLSNSSNVFIINAVLAIHAEDVVGIVVGRGCIAWHLRFQLFFRQNF